MRDLRKSVIRGAALAVALTWTSAASADPQIGLNLPLAGGVPSTQDETSVAVNPNNPLQLVAAAVTYFVENKKGCVSPADTGEYINSSTVALYGSKDGGATWEYHCAPWPSAVAGGLEGADEWYGDDPSVAWDAEGNAYAAYMLLSWPYGETLHLSSAIAVARTTDAGTKWTTWSVVANDITKLHPFHEKPKIAVDTSTEGRSSHPSRVYVTWSRDLTQQVAWSDDGTTWKQKSFNFPSGDHHGGNVAVGPDGAVYVIWNKIHPVDELWQPKAYDTVWLSKSVDGGDTWSEPVQILSLNRGSLDAYYLPPAQDNWWVNSYPSIDIQRNPESPYYNRIHLAWTDRTTCVPYQPYPCGSYDIYSSYSADGGATWSPRLRVNDNADEAYHFLPWLAVDQSDGAVHVAWYDTRLDPETHEPTQVYTSRSADGGDSFGRDLCLTDGGSTFQNHINYSNLNHKTNDDTPSATQYGDYLGVAAFNRKMIAVWTDSRQFFDQVYTDLLEDAAVGSATYCSRPKWAPGPVPEVQSPASGSIQITLPQLLSWGTNATGGTTDLLRYSGADCTGVPVEIQVPGGALQATDAPPIAGTYSYQVRVRNDCPGTELTPMSSLSVCSTPVIFVP